MFQVQNLVPMQTDSRCIVVTANSSVPGLVKTWFGQMDADGLQDNVKLGVQEGTGGSFGDCTGFTPGVGFHPSATLSDLAGAAGMNHTDYASGILPWPTTGVSTGESRTYKFTWVFDTAGLTQPEIDALQGKLATVNINWELQNT